MQEASAKPSVFKLLLMQFKLLLKKNFNVKKRNRKATPKSSRPCGPVIRFAYGA